MCVAHDFFQEHTLAVANATRTVDDAASLLLKALEDGQCLGQTGHREIEVGLVVRCELCLVDPSQRTRLALLLEVSANVVAGGFEY